VYGSHIPGSTHENPIKAAQVTPITTEKSDIEEIKGIVQQLVSKVDSYDRERQQTSGCPYCPHLKHQGSS
jgi:hypothetical protein